MESAALAHSSSFACTLPQQECRWPFWLYKAFVQRGQRVNKITLIVRLTRQFSLGHQKMIKIVSIVLWGRLIPEEIVKYVLRKWYRLIHGIQIFRVESCHNKRNSIQSKRERECIPLIFQDLSTFILIIIKFRRIRRLFFTFLHPCNIGIVSSA
jgi:hypothetical protein